MTKKVSGWVGMTAAKRPKNEKFEVGQWVPPILDLEAWCLPQKKKSPLERGNVAFGLRRFLLLSKNGGNARRQRLLGRD